MLGICYNLKEKNSSQTDCKSLIRSTHSGLFVIVTVAHLLPNFVLPGRKIERMKRLVFTPSRTLLTRRHQLLNVVYNCNDIHYFIISILYPLIFDCSVKKCLLIFLRKVFYNIRVLNEIALSAFILKVMFCDHQEKPFHFKTTHFSLLRS